MNDRLKLHFGSNPILWVPAWGLSKLRKRGGAFAGALAGKALWYDAWYDRVMTEDTVARLVDLGINLVVWPFSLGGPDPIEEAERDTFERMTGYLHARGMVSLPYLQYQNILQEAFTLPGCPWGVHLDGSRKQFTYWRRTACQTAPDFVSYFKGLIDDALRRGADGIWIDNTYHFPCRCVRCEQEFKEWLPMNRRALLDGLYLEDFDHVEMPTSTGNTADPLTQALLDFTAGRHLALLREYVRHMRAVKPEALFASNPGLDRRPDHYARGLDLHPLLALHDLVYVENKFFPGLAGEQVVGNYHGFLAAEACGAKAIPGAWIRADFDKPVAAKHTGLPETRADIRRVLFEAAACGGAPGMLWFLRTQPEHRCSGVDDLMTVYGEHPDLLAAEKEALAFLRALPADGGENQANVAVWRHRESLAYFEPRSWAGVLAAEEILHASGLPYQVLHSEDFEQRADRMTVIVMAEPALLSEGDGERIRAYLERGGRLLVLGDPGLYDERFRERRDFLLGDVLGVSRFRRPEDFVWHALGAGRSACLPWTGASRTCIPRLMPEGAPLPYPRWYDARKTIVAAMDRLLGADRQVRLAGLPHAGVTLRNTGDGATAVHILGYAGVPTGSAPMLDLHPSLLRAETPRWHVPGQAPQTLSGQPAPNGSRRFNLPCFEDYGVLLA